jgi:hypothetical protein
MQVLYVDSLETDAVTVPTDGTRCSVWTNQMISRVADLDTDINGCFGALQVTFVLNSFYIFFSVHLFFMFFNRVNIGFSFLVNSSSHVSGRIVHYSSQNLQR